MGEEGGKVLEHVSVGLKSPSSQLQGMGWALTVDVLGGEVVISAEEALNWGELQKQGWQVARTKNHLQC